MDKDDLSTPERPRRVTAQTVADAAGVSRSAVSRAFTPGAYLDADKRKKIHEVANQMGYQPNALAAGLKGGRSHLVAVFVGNMRSAYDTEFVSTLVGELNALNKWPILIDGGDQRAESAIDRVLRYPLDALILRGGSMSEELVDMCIKFSVPIISSGRIVDAPGVDNVCCRNAIGTRLATEMLVKQGRSRFGFIGGTPDFYSSSERRAGVQDTLSALGMSLIAETTGQFTVESGYAATLELLENNILDALICANDAMAIGALTAAQDAGVCVPDNMSIVGFDDIEMAKWPSFNLTTIHNPIGAAVDQVISLMESRLNNPDKQPETVFIDPYIVERGTHTRID